MAILDVPTYEKDGVSALKDRTEPTSLPGDESSLAQSIAALVKDKKVIAEFYRLQHEKIWARCYRQFRGMYGPDVQFTETEKSRVFIKITKTKTLAALGQIMDILYANGSFPITIDPTEKPVGAQDVVSISSSTPSNPEQEFKSPYGYPDDGEDWGPGKTVNEIITGPAISQELGDGLEAKVGQATDPQTQVEIHPAERIAKKMEKTILDQLEESSASTHLKHCAFEMALLGTGIIKGPFTYTKTYHQWVPDPDNEGKMKYAPVKKDMPQINAVSIWNFYVDPEATNLTDAEYVIERHGFTRDKLRGLCTRPGFRKNVIEYILENFRPDYVKKWFENTLFDFNAQTQSSRYEVLEYWGIIDKKICEKFGLDIDDEFKDQDQLQVNAWICCNQVIRFILNPFTPARLPYQACPYELNPYQFWGVGIPENMDDSQQIMNGHARMAIDNLALAGNLVFEVDETNLVNGEDMRIFPGRIFRRQGGQPGQSIFAIKFPNTATENLQMFDKFRQLADESTGIPSYSHGQTGVSGTTRTSSGMSMLMGAAALNVKTVIRNIDDYLIRPLGEGLFAWNMQFNPDIEIHGDLEIKARGTSSLMLKEVRSQRLLMFMQTGSSPALAPFIKWPTVLKELARDLEIDPDKFVNNIEEAQTQALILRAHAEASGQGADQQGQSSTPGPSPSGNSGGSTGGVGGTSPGDTQGSGNGTIGTGVPQPAGSPGFTGNGRAPA